MTSNAERIALLHRYRTPSPHPSWMEPRNSVIPWRALTLLGVMAVFGLILRGIYVRALEHDSHMSITDIVAQCQSEGKSAKIERGADGTVRGILCSPMETK